MTNEEIIEGNKLIAEWISGGIATDGHPQGSKKWSVHLPREFCDKISIRYHPYNPVLFVFEYELYFHSSWDWIFSVIEKITSLGFEIEFNIKPNWDESTFSIYDTKRDNTLVESLNFIDIENCNSLIQYVWICIIEFILWYNNQKKE